MNYFLPRLRQISKNYVLASMAAATCLYASGANALTFDVRGEYEYWKSGLGGNANGILGGLGVSHQLNDKISLAGGAIGGKFNTNSISKNDIGRFDLDLTASYQVQPMTAMYLGYQLIQLGVDVPDDNARSFSDQLHALGFGASNYFALRYKWYAYGGASVSGVIANSKLNSGATDLGKGFSTSINGGLLYLISNKMSMGFGFKTRLTNVNYGGDSGTWAHNAVRATVSISRSM